MYHLPEHFVQLEKMSHVCPVFFFWRKGSYVKTSNSTTPFTTRTPKQKKNTKESLKLMFIFLHRFIFSLYFSPIRPWMALFCNNLLAIYTFVEAGSRFHYLKKIFLNRSGQLVISRSLGPPSEPFHVWRQGLLSFMTI